ncbi:MAG TPA: lipoyl(octanoyl) transferase LipB [Geobacteraceae bacterium]|nr:lipoyl(octanoyl) transferase LipB [Geobacteraceae bacterium]
MLVRDLGIIDFHDAFAVQVETVAAVAAGGEETLLLLEHPPVYTIGSGGKAGNVLDPAISAVRVNRGGDVTYHGPGQLIGYPIIDLGRRGRDLHRYLRFLEELIIIVAGEFQVAARRVAGRTGVWCGATSAPAKLASIGVGVRRWVTMHGFAINVSMDPAPFRRINPCGIAACPVTSLADEHGAAIAMKEIKQEVVRRFEILLAHCLPIMLEDI